MDQWYGLLECEHHDNPLAMALTAETGHMAAKNGGYPKWQLFQWEHDDELTNKTAKQLGLVCWDNPIALRLQSPHIVQGFARLNRAGTTAATLTGIPAKNWWLGWLGATLWLLPAMISQR